MKTLNTIITLLILLVVGGIYLQGDKIEFGSVEPMGGYDYVQYTDEAATATTTKIMEGAGMLGSVIINEDPAGTIVFYDSATTTTTGLASTTHATRIADFQKASAEGTYTFDVNVTKGLVWVTSLGGDNFDGDITVTYRSGY